MAPPRTGSNNSMEIVPYSGDLELELPAVDVKRQDSLYRDANRPAHGDHHGQVYTHIDTSMACVPCVSLLFLDVNL